MDTLLESIYDKAVTDLVDTGLVNGVYLSRGKERAKPPYLLVDIIDIGVSHTFDSSRDNVRVQFTIYSNQPSVEEACNIYSQIKDSFDESRITIVGYSNIRMQRVSSLLQVDPDNGWDYIVEYLLWLQET